MKTGCYGEPDMAERGSRYRFVLVEEPETALPVRYRRTRPVLTYQLRRAHPLEVLYEAFLQVSRRGEGPEAWASSLADNPVAFLLDAMADPVILRQRGGQPVYANPAARRLRRQTDLGDRDEVAVETLELDGERYERRCMRFESGRLSMVLEILHRVG
jgi:PAS domain-containing protein